MSVKVTVQDLETGEMEEAVIPDGEYLLITVDPCYLAHTNAYSNGTVVLTVKGRKKNL